jgi:murein DD-endopeptidase MepM/ murein hydrolase activator NlpD
LTEPATILQQYNIKTHPVVPFDAATDKLLKLDFTSSNKELDPEILHDSVLFSAWVNDKLKIANARYGIGGYAEHRTIYSASKVFDGKVPGDEPRRLHLGTDIWGKPNTPVMAPLDGLVHSFANNDNFGDYGPTIILSHNIAGNTFYTLYGHLSLHSIKNLQEGMKIGKGDIFAEFGIPSENGQWPSHLHFQLILDPGEQKGDYPGVCKYAEREKWLANSPDPDILLQMNRYLPA